MRRISLLIGAVLSLSGTAAARPYATPPAASPAVSATTLYVSGRGWGHGVGMSQYGALGFANEGRGYEEILAYFYPGTALGPAPVARVRVLLQERSSVSISSPVPFRVRDVFGKTYPLEAGELKLGPQLEVAVNGAPSALAGPIVFLPGTRSLELGSPYRGQLEVSVTGQKVSVVNAVGLENYLAGVVPREMPAAWHVEALKAQAVAARSYALAHRVGGKGYDLYSDVRSQVYGGVAAEDLRATAAIEATAGQVLLYEGKIADALFHSTSGGRTIAAAEAFGKDVPYLVGVDDPFSALSPAHRWGPVAIGDALARKGLGLRSAVTGLRLIREPSGRVRSAVVRTALGEATVSGTTLRRELGLRSTWITAVSSLMLTRPGAAAVYGRAVVLSGEVKGAKGLVLSQRSEGGWKQVLERPVGGAFTFKTKLLAPTSFRLAAGTLNGPVLKVPVAPLVRVTREAAALAGVVSPATPGAAVEVQRLEGETWIPAGQSVVDEAGGFRLELDLPPGSYRARVAPAAGFAAGISATLRIAG
ncbi:MAG: SpoIID/LytB domain-containing protein [Actinobacteria bacterium]|nr:SpoIID/LytB domain-containing protein [Actinomycetota bacterium]